MRRGGGQVGDTVGHKVPNFPEGEEEGRSHDTTRIVGDWKTSTRQVGGKREGIETLLGDDKEKIGRQLGDNVPRYLEPCIHMGNDEVVIPPPASRD